MESDATSVTPFQYENPVRKEYARTALEEAAILIAGFVQYAQEGANSRDWDLDYDWPSFRKKLTGDAMSFDNNHFDTNMLTHAVSGTLYYQAARGNRLDILEAGLLALAASAFWEYVGEFREKVSLNDLVVTPLSGIAIGEVLTQLGAYFDRGRSNALTESLSLLFGTSKNLHDRMDSNVRRRARDTDALGLSREAGHAFELGAGIAATSVTSATPEAAARATYVDATVGLRMHLVNVPEHERAGRTSRFLTDGNVSKLTAEAAFGQGGLADLSLLTQVAPAGWYAQALEGEDATRLSGRRAFVGTTVGFDYALHRYDRARGGPLDAISSVHVAGLTVECDGLFGALRVRSTLDAHPSFAAVSSFALATYVARGGDLATVPTVTRNEGYYFGWGATVAPSVDVLFRGWRLGGEARVDGFWSIAGLDRNQDQLRHEASLGDWRTSVRGSIGYAPAAPLLVSVAVVERVRGGRLDGAGASLRETSVLSGVTAVF